MKNEKATEYLIAETASLLKVRRGGAVNVILASLLLEAARMKNEGFDIPEGVNTRLNFHSRP